MHISFDNRPSRKGGFLYFKICARVNYRPKQYFLRCSDISESLIVSMELKMQISENEKWVGMKSVIQTYHIYLQSTLYYIINDGLNFPNLIAMIAINYLHAEQRNQFLF